MEEGREGGREGGKRGNGEIAKGREGGRRGGRAGGKRGNGESSRIIVLAHLPNGNESRGVLVWLVGVDVVQGGGLGGVTVASREVYADCEVDLAASHDVFQERVGARHLGTHRHATTW